MGLWRRLFRAPTREHTAPARVPLLGEALAAGLAAGLAAAVYTVAQILGRRAPFGPRVSAVNDLGDQFIPMHAQLWDLLHGSTDSDLFFSWSSAGGHPFLPDYVAYLASPSNLLLLVVPRSGVEAAVAALVILRLALAAALMTHLLRRLRPDGPDWAFALLGAAYGTCAWAVDDASYVPMWLDGFVGLPLLVLAGLWARDGRRPVAGVLAVTAVWWSNFYSAYMATLGAILLIVTILLADGADRREWWRTASRYAWRTAAGGLLAGIGLIPELVAINASVTSTPTHVQNALPLAPYLPRLFPFTEGAGLSPSLGFGTLPLLAALTVPLHPGLTWRQRIVLPAGVAVLVTSMTLPQGFVLWHLGIVPNGSPWRQAFVVAALGVVLAAYAVSAARPLPAWRMLVPAVGLVALARWLPGHAEAAMLTRWTQAWTLAAVALAVAVAAAAQADHASRANRAERSTPELGRWLVIAVLGAFLLAEQMIGAVVIGKVRDVRIPGSYVWAVEDARVGPAVRPWRADGTQWPDYRLNGLATTGLNGPNDGMLYGVPTTTFYSSTMQQAVGEMWIGLGAPYAANGRIIFPSDDPGLNALMGVNGLLTGDGTVQPREALPVVRRSSLQPTNPQTPVRSGPGSAVFARRNAAIGAQVYTLPEVTARLGASPVDLSTPLTLNPGDRVTMSLECRAGTIPQLYAPDFVGAWTQTEDSGRVVDTHLQPSDRRRRGVESGVPAPTAGPTLQVTALNQSQLPADPVACLDPDALGGAIAAATAPGARPTQVELRGSRMRIDLGRPADTTVVVATAAQDGWTCTADGSPVVPRSMGGLFAVPLTGQRELSCRFTPPGLWRGAAVSLLGAAMALGPVVTARLRTRPATPPRPRLRSAGAGPARAARSRWPVR